MDRGQHGCRHIPRKNQRLLTRAHEASRASCRVAPHLYIARTSAASRHTICNHVKRRPRDLRHPETSPPIHRLYGLWGSILWITRDGADEEARPRQAAHDNQRLVTQDDRAILRSRCPTWRKIWRLQTMHSVRPAAPPSSIEPTAPDAHVRSQDATDDHGIPHGAHRREGIDLASTLPAASVNVDGSIPIDGGDTDITLDFVRIACVIP